MFPLKSSQPLKSEAQRQLKNTLRYAPIGIQIFFIIML